MEYLIGEMLWEGAERGIEVMRCKGVFVDSDTGKTLMLQGVEEKFEFREVPDCKGKSNFLFVGKGNLDAEAVKKEMLERCGK